jgi:hypothetical protein
MAKHSTKLKKAVITGVEILSQNEFASTRVERKSYILCDGQSTLVTVLRPIRSARYSLRIQLDFLQRSIYTESPSSLLIDQKKTEEMWNGVSVGIPPEEFIKDEPVETIAFDATNAGWQKGAIWIKNGQLLILPNEKDTLSGKFSTLAMNSQGDWFDTILSIRDGKIDQKSNSSVNQIVIGFTMPKILQDGRILPLEEYIGDPRLLADFRNVFDFAVGKQFPDKYWSLLRGFLPHTEFAGKRLIRGDTTVIRNPSIKTPDATNRLEELIVQAGLTETIIPNYNLDQSIARIIIAKKLPKNRIPLMGLGYSNERRLIVVCVDGRQPGITVGATIEETAYIMLENGIRTGFIGSAGGDVIVATNTVGFLNSPSNKSVSRPVPSVLTIQ